MKGYLTSFANLFEAPFADDRRIENVEVPLIQRDYAQGRLDGRAEEIRANFLEVLLDAVSGDEPIGLDFVYGKIDGGVFHPLDGQQRLTTLFLLHWYLASATGRLTATDHPWTQFSYATRPSARLFCRRLACNPLPRGEESASTWIRDQEWYLHVWRNDPTVQAMLVMIDAMHSEIARRGTSFDVEDAWIRLTHDLDPAVSFYLLPLEDLDSDEDLYVKMNSRGKPLTPFENFKARFEQDIAHSERAEEFAHKIDGAWSDLVWPYHGGDNIVDDEFWRYIDFITEICELREDRLASGRLAVRARAVFGADNPRSAEHLDFLFNAFDMWHGEVHVRSVFESVFSGAGPAHQSYDPTKVTLHGSTATNLFEQCLHQFDSEASGNRAFTLQQSLLLYGVLLHLIHDTEEFPRRVRVLRNLIAASEDETRRQNMPALLNDVEAVVVNGDLDGVSRLSSNQVEDERLKRKFLGAYPELAEVLFRLEDHPLLRGTLSAFDFDGPTFARRAAAFEAAFSDSGDWLALTGALLATGEYQRRRPNSTGWQFGTSSPAREAMWRYLLTNAPRDELSATRTVLARFLDGLAASGEPVRVHCEAVMESWLAAREESALFDWRYHLVKYPLMRGAGSDRSEGATGIYFGIDGRLGYSLCMLRTRQLNGNYRDPILLQVWASSGVEEQVENLWFTGYETQERWLRLTRSGAGLRSVDEGFVLRRPEDLQLAGVFEALCSERNDVEKTDGEHMLLRIPQAEHGGSGVDTLDRVQVGAEMVVQMVQAGL